SGSPSTTACSRSRPSSTIPRRSASPASRFREDRMADKPSGVMFFGVIALFLGILGVLGGAFGLVALAIPQKTAAPVNDPKFAEMNEEFQRRVQAVAKEA